MKQTAMKMAVAIALGAASVSANAALFKLGDRLSIDNGVATYDAAGYVINVSSGSFFGMDTGGDSKIANTEKTPMVGLSGIVMGKTQGKGVIDSWSFFGSPGTDFTSVAPTGNTGNGGPTTASGINLSGWTVFWPNPGGANIPMGTGAWTPPAANCTNLGCTGITFNNGIAAISWDGTYGHTYSLWYTATVPVGSPCCDNVKYLLHLVGTVSVPVPAAAWLFGSGLLGLVGIARRKKKISA